MKLDYGSNSTSHAALHVRSFYGVLFVRMTEPEKDRI